MSGALDRLRGGGDAPATPGDRLEAAADMLEEFARARIVDGDAPTPVAMVGDAATQGLHRPHVYEGAGGEHVVLLETVGDVVELVGAAADGATLHRRLPIDVDPAGRVGIAPGHSNVFDRVEDPDRPAILRRLGRLFAGSR